MKKKSIHKFHLVDQSPWPLLASISSFLLVTSFIIYLNRLAYSGFILVLGLLIVILISALWWRDVIREAVYEGRHTQVVQAGLKVGMLLFIVSEIMFFFSFFWAFFHSSLSPSVQIGCTWPPMGITPFNPWSIPLLNTVILVLSGATVTCVHYGLIANSNKLVIGGFLFTIFLAGLFTAFQCYEYFEAPFSINDSVFGSVFFMTTGFHGLHVFIGTIFLIICFIRYFAGHFSEKHHVGFEVAAWYWHFVDVVWLFVYIFFYVWSFEILSFY